MITLTGAGAIDSSENGLMSTLFPSIAQALHLNDSQLGLMTSAGKIVTVPAGPALSWVAGRIGRKRTVVILTAAAGLFGVLAGMSTNFPMLLVLATLMSACVMGNGPIVNAILMDLFDDAERGKAAGYYYGIVNSITALLGPVIASFTRLNNGWRIGLFVVGGVCLLASLAVAFFFHDPGIGASEHHRSQRGDGAPDRTRFKFREAISLFKIPTFSIMMFSRMISGQLILGNFGVQFLVTERGFTNAMAAVVLAPNGIGYFLGTITGGTVVAWLDRILPYRGRVWFIQGAQFVFAFFAFFGTQIVWGPSIVPYAVFWGLMGFSQGLNPAVNRPMTAAVVLPELRSLAFALFITVFEMIGTAVFSLTAGYLATEYSIQAVFSWILIGLMIVNGLILGLMHICYPSDARKMAATLAAREAQAAREASGKCS